MGKKLTIEEIQALAKSKGGKCLSKEYKNNTTRLKFECANGHIWPATTHDIKQGTWCPECAIDKKLTIEEMQALAKLKGGECLSSEYKNYSTELHWKCNKGHRWWTSPSVIKRGSWCPECSLDRKRLSIEKMQEHAKSKGGECLSSNYKNGKTILRWRCRDGHEWETAAENIMNSNTWCPYCSINHSEERCRSIFETLTGKKFIKDRRVLGNLLELDGYCKELSVAFEYQGEQHYEDVPHFHRGKKTLKKQRAVDAEKKRKCREKNITLIEIPHTRSAKNSLLAQFIYTELVSRNISIFKKPDKIKFEDFKIAQSKILELSVIAENKGGKLLTKEYTNSITPLEFECANGHRWFARPAHIKQGHWCPKCAGLQRLTIEEMRMLAKSRGGKCLSIKYVNSTTPLKFECADGHKWSGRPADLRNSGSWCPECAREKLKLTIEEMRVLAKSRGGKCLSTKYTNVSTKLQWECKKRHRWSATPHAVKEGHWCPECVGRAKGTIEKMQALAISRGGKCLSEKHINSDTKLEFECVNGHIWRAKPHGIQQGTWCPECARGNRTRGKR